MNTCLQIYWSPHHPVAWLFSYAAIFVYYSLLENAHKKLKCKNIHYKGLSSNRHKSSLDTDKKNHVIH